MFRIRLLAFITGAATIVAGQLAFCQNLREDIRHPILAWQVEQPTKERFADLLAGFCKSEPDRYISNSFKCNVKSLGQSFYNKLMLDDEFFGWGLIMGHFLSPESEDAVLSGSSLESHAAWMGGTLLLTKREGKWVPLWYRSGLLTHSCEKVKLPSGREILLCECPDGGMGHKSHYLYSVDLMNPPTDITRDSLAVTDTYTDMCSSQDQEISRVQWASNMKTVLVEIRTTDFLRRNMTEPVCRDLELKRPPASIKLRFAVSNNGFQKIK